MCYANKDRLYKRQERLREWGLISWAGGTWPREDHSVQSERKNVPSTGKSCAKTLG
jgi:hypothetical protein